MRVALVVPYSLDEPGGVATHAIGLAGWLAANGHEPHVFAPGSAPAPSPVPVTSLGSAVPFRFNGSVARLGVSPLQAARVRAAVRGFDVVHVHEPLTPGIGFSAARAAESLVVTHHASFAPRGPLTTLLRARARRLGPRVALAVSPAAADLVATITGERPDVVPNAISMPQRPSGRTGRPIVAFLGRLSEPRKGYSTFVDIAARVSDADFVAIGPGGTGAPGVTELGRLSEAEKSAWLGRASVLVAPNRYGESFGMVLIEALSRGAAVVASDLPAFRAVVGDRAVASFFPVDDAITGATLVARRLDQPHDPAAAWRSVAPYGWDRVGPRIIEAYRRATGLRRSVSSMS